MEGAIIARVLHILGVVLWIGGVAMVTTVLLPATKRMKTPVERVMFFETVERGFALQARITTLLTGLSGLYLVYKLNLWQRFLHIESVSLIHISEPTRRTPISYAVFCLKKK